MIITIISGQYTFCIHIMTEIIDFNHYNLLMCQEDQKSIKFYIQIIGLLHPSILLQVFKILLFELIFVLREYTDVRPPI